MKRIKLKGKITKTVIDQTIKSLQENIVLLPTEFNYVFASTNPGRLMSIPTGDILNDNQKVEPAQFVIKSEVPYEQLNELARKILDHFSSSPLIAIIPALNGKIGIQITSSELITKILAQIKTPIYFIENEESDWLNQYRDRLALYIETDLKKRLLSTILDLSSAIPIIIRKGAIPILAIEKVLGRRIKLGRGIYFSVLFVCSGNSCRSPMAKGILEKMLENQNVFVYSAGTIAGAGNLPSEFAIKAVQKYGADISNHLSAPLTKELIDHADLILVMSPKHKDAVLELVPEADVKTFLLKEYAFGQQEEIEDPVGQPLSVFERIAAVIFESLEKVADDIKARLN
ncbi:MAG: hypothetical protein ABIK93_00090 [candidate division WOR-3 bacterium]